MFAITRSKGFRLTFANGWTASVQFGNGNYCENLWRNGGFWAESKDAEIAAWDAAGNWFPFDFDEVKGYCSADEVAVFLATIAALPRDGRKDMAPSPLGRDIRPVD